MSAETKMQFICSDNFNAPSLGNAWGVLIDVLDVALVNGLPLPTISKAVGSGAQLVLTFAENHKIKMFQVVRLTGFSPNSLNADFRVIGVPSGFEIVIETNVSTGIALGQASLKPLGYEKSFSGTNQAVYRDKDQTALHRPFLRVDNSLDPAYTGSYAKYAKVGVLQDCAGMNDLTGAQIPFDSSNPTKNWVGTGSGVSAFNGWSKWYYARSANAYNGSADSKAPTIGSRNWMVVGDGQSFYLLNPMTATSDLMKLIYGFGVYNATEGMSITPYFLLSTLDYVSAGTSRDPSVIAGMAPLYSPSNPVVVFNGIDSQYQQNALPAHGKYSSGLVNTYANDFACLPYALLSNSYLIGTLKFIRYVEKSRTDAEFSSISFSNNMYVFDVHMTGANGAIGRIAFNLGKL